MQPSCRIKMQLIKLMPSSLPDMTTVMDLTSDPSLSTEWGLTGSILQPTEVAVSVTALQALHIFIASLPQGKLKRKIQVESIQSQVRLRHPGSWWGYLKSWMRLRPVFCQRKIRHRRMGWSLQSVKSHLQTGRHSSSVLLARTASRGRRIRSLPSRVVADLSAK